LRVQIVSAQFRRCTFDAIELLLKGFAGAGFEPAPHNLLDHRKNPRV
jgi:hypothetical protein